MKNHLFSALRVRPFLFLWLAELLSQIASNMTNFILLLVVFSLTNSNTAVSGIMIAFLLPAILFGIFAGVFVDHQDKKHVLTGTNIARALILLLLAFSQNSLFFVYLLTFAVATATQFFIPAETPMIPLLVDKKLLLSANALFGIAFYGSLLVAYALSGPLLIFFGQSNVFLALCIMFLIASIFSSLIKRSSDVKVQSRLPKNITVGGEIKIALHTIFASRKISHSFLLLSLSQILVLVIAVIGPGFATHILQIPVSSFPLLFVMPAAIGMGVGAFILTNYFHSISKDKIINIGLFTTAIAIFLLPFGGQIISRPFVNTFNTQMPEILQLTKLNFMAILAFFSGLANAFMFVPANTLIQEETNDEMRGKIYGALNSLISLLSLLPIVIVGSLADVFGVATVLLVLGICVGIIGIIRLVTTRE
ncbi:MAG TPA: MFS transporter [Patescibacteria group bacterium]|nr:MFS transporter [Patescibacteria group bacterium]